MEKRLSTQKITSNLWFNMQAEEAVNFYLTVFKDGKIGRKTYYGAEGVEFHGIPEGTVMTIEFIIAGQEFVALNGGPHFQFTEAISFIVNCKDQKEVDYYWEKLSEGGDEKAQMCGWLKDKFGVSWQVVPEGLTDMLQSPDKAKVANMSKALFQMKKLDIAALEKAFGK